MTNHERMTKEKFPRTLSYGFNCTVCENRESCASGHHRMHDCVEGMFAWGGAEFVDEDTE